MPEESDETISLFLRDERTGRRVFNARALQALGIDPVDVHERGFPISHQREDLTGLHEAARRD